MKTVKKYWLGAIAPLFFCFGAYCQNGTVAYNISTQPPVQYSGNEASVLGGRVIFTSAIAGNKYPSNSEKYTIDDMYYIDLLSLFKPSTSTRENTINAQRLGGVAKVVVKVFAFNFDKNTNGKGELIYQLEKNGDEPEHPVKVELYLPSPNIYRHTNVTFIASNNTKALLQNTKARDKFGNIISVPSTKTQYAFNLFPYLADLSDNDVLEYTETQKILNKTDGKIPVIVEVEVTQAKVNEITVPGLNKPVYLGTFDPYNELTVNLFLNKETSPLATMKSSSDNTGFQQNFIMGNKITYKVALKNTISTDPPEITGMPGVWLANFGGNSRYFCSPSVTPGEFSPWIGFDSNVHGVALQRYPTPLDPNNGQYGNKFDEKLFQLHVPPWKKTGDKWEWGWTLQREMNEKKISYEPVYNWSSSHVIPNGDKIEYPDGSTKTIQRRNQKEGIAMDLLRHYSNKPMTLNDYRNYSGIPYIAGIDDDELVYLGLNESTTDQATVFKEKYAYWKYLYPFQENDDPVINMVTAYRRNREQVINGVKNYSKTYDGYEIQDLGTDYNHPNGDASFNNSAPGIVTIKKDGYKVTIPINVFDPFITNRGFYGHIIGPAWPAAGERDLKYSLSGLNGMSSQEISKFTLVFRSQNTSGYVGTIVRKASDLTTEQLNKISANGRWTESFDTKQYGNSGYFTVTAYYQVSNDSEMVPVAGKNIKPIQLRFLAINNFKRNDNGKIIETNEPLGTDYLKIDEGRGDGAYTYATSYRQDEAYGKYQYTWFPRADGKGQFQNPIHRTYTFQKPNRGTPSIVRFVALDSDPHTFIIKGTDFYQSEKALASRVPEDTIKKNLKYYLDFINQDGSINKSTMVIGTGLYVDLKLTTMPLGKYYLRAVYGNGGELGATNFVIHKINIVSYSAPNQSTVVNRPLTDFEKKTLNLISPLYTFLEVKDILSTHMYTDGPRVKQYSNDKINNRFENFNAYANSYNWSGLDVGSPNDQRLVDNWIASYESGKRKDWLPKNWVRHLDPNISDKIPNVTITDFSNSDEARQKLEVLFNNSSLPEKWQLRLPWIALTQTSGSQARTNIKAVYNMKALFDNNDGAFSGNSKLPNLDVIRFKLTTNENLDAEELYWDLKCKRKVLVYGFNNTNVKVVNETDNTKVVYDASPTTISETEVPPYSNPPVTTTKPAAKQASIAQTAAPKLEGLVVYPNPNEGQFNISWENPNEGEVSITLFSLNGAELFSKKEHVASGNNTGVFDTGSALPTGIYVLKIIGNGFERKTKVSVKSD